MADTHVAEPQPPLSLNVFCSKLGDVWRVHTRPTRLPRYLHHFFDHNGEVYPALLDFDDLDRYMAANDAPYEKRVSKLGGVELSAKGHSAAVLSQWLATAFASGVRSPTR